MLHNIAEYTDHGYSSGLTKSVKKHRIRRGKSLGDIHEMNAQRAADLPCVYPYGGYEIQRVPIGGGFCLIAPLYNEAGIYAIGGNVVYQQYLDADRNHVERIFYSAAFKKWVDPIKFAEIEAIENLYDRFLVTWRLPWMPSNTIPEILAKVANGMFTEKATWTQPFELTAVE